MRKTYNLGGTAWQFGSVPRRAFDAPDVDDRSDVAEYLPATVPGNVRTDLFALGRIPNPLFDDCYRASLWVEDFDWWYRRSLGTSVGAGQRAFLIFDSIDYLSAVFVNGLEIGRHEGMFSRQVYEVTEALRVGDWSPEISPALSPAEIAIRVWGSGALPRRRLSPLERARAWLADRLDPTGIGAFPDRTATVKCQMSFGWDFAPPIRTMGVWDDVWLVVTGGVFVEDVWIKSQIPDAARRLAHLTLQVTLDTDRSRAVWAGLNVRPANFDGPDFGPVFFDLDLPPGRSVHTLRFDLPNPELWEPWDRGFPHLYELIISIRPSASAGRPGEAVGAWGTGAGETGSPQPLDSLATRFGVRDIRLDNWIFTLNDRREFIRGVNWVPADCFPGRLRRDDYADLLGMGRAAGVNLLRVWGGGLREKRSFYDLCDELGLLVWQEFPFSCSFLGYFPRDAGWLGLAERECTAIVRALRNHPSLVLWCGGNEFSSRRNRPLAQTLARVVGAHDEARSFVPASPSPGDVHTWGVWHGKYPLHAYREEGQRFWSEFGLQAPPSGETLRTCLPDSELWPPGAGWEVHNAELGKLWRYASSILPPDRKANRAGGDIASLEEFIAASQRAQALGLQIAIEHVRRRKGEAGGLCLWQFNEPWPAISWAIVDYWRRPKFAYRRLKDLYNPVLVGLTFSPARFRPGDILQAELWAVNDTLESLDGCRLLIDLDGTRIHESRVTLLPDRVQVIGTLRHKFQTEPGDLRVILRQGERIIARNTYDLTYCDMTPARWRDRVMRWMADALLR